MTSIMELNKKNKRDDSGFVVADDIYYYGGDLRFSVLENGSVPDSVIGIGTTGYTQHSASSYIRGIPELMRRLQAGGVTMHEGAFYYNGQRIVREAEFADRLIQCLTSIIEDIT